MWSAISRLVEEEGGQELVEYALVGATIGLAMALSFQLLLSALGTAYGNWLAAFDGLWEPSAPGS